MYIYMPYYIYVSTCIDIKPYKFDQNLDQNSTLYYTI